MGHDLLITEGHPVVTRNRGPVVASELKVGDQLITSRGISTVTVVQEKMFDGAVHNLLLGTEEELTQVGEDQTTMFANGILIGDARMQDKYQKEKHLRKKKVEDWLPPEWMEDYKNAKQRGVMKQ